MTKSEIADRIRSALPGSSVDVKSDDDTHFQALVVAEQFEGKRRIARHQLVYGAIGSAVGREIHALSLTTLTPEEWGARSHSD